MKPFSHRLPVLGFALLLAFAGLFYRSALRSVSSAEPLEPVTTSVRVLSIPTSDIVFSPVDQTIYASIPGDVPTIGNSIARIDPSTGAITGHSWIGSDPRKLALSADGSVLYAYLAGAFSIGRYDIGSQTTTGKFLIGQDSFYGLFAASDLAVSPDDPNVVAVARQKQGTSPPQHGVAVFSSGSQLPQTGPGHTQGSDNLAFGANGQVLYGTGMYSALTTMSVTSSGVSVVNNGGPGSGSLKFQAGKLFTSSGHVIDAQTRTLLGTFPNAATSAFVPDTSIGRAFYLTRENSTTLSLKVFDINTFAQLAGLTISGLSGDPTSLVRWGTNGLAFRTTSGQVVLLQTTLIPTENPLPPPPPLPTPTPTATPFSARVRQIPIVTNDIEYSSASSKLYVSVPGSVGVERGNTITEIDPVSGGLGSSIPIGSEPKRLALADDGSTLYVALDGAASVRKLDLTSGVADPPFYLGNNSNGPNTARDIDVMPGSSSIVAVSRSGGGISIFENGIVRPQSGSAGEFIDFLDPSVLYGGGGTLTRYSVSSSGLAQAGTFPSGSNGELSILNGKIYSANGRVVDSASPNVDGTFSGLGWDNAFVVDYARNRAFFVSYNGTYTIRSYELDTLRFVGSVALTGVTEVPRKLVRWGSNGLAFRTDAGKVFLIESDLIDPSEPVPTPTPTPAVTPTPSPTPLATSLRTIDLSANDLIYNEPSGSLIASVAGIAGSPTGNSISYVDPVSGTVQRSVFIGSEPNRLAGSDDGTTLYTGLGGANAIRKFDIATATPGLQFSTSVYFSRPHDMAVMPGNPNTIAVAGDIADLAVFDNGVQRPQTPDGGAYAINSIAYSSEPNTLYGYDNHSSGFELVRFSTAGGNVTGTFLASNLVSGYSTRIKYHNGLLYTNTGRVVDPEAKTLIGTFPGGGGSTFAIDGAKGRIFFLTGGTITAFDIATYVKIGAIALSQTGAFPSSLVRWGDNGLAFRAEPSAGSGISRVYLVQSHLVDVSTTVPTGIQFSSSATSVSETSASTTVSVFRSGDVSQVSTVDYATSNGSAEAGSDYVLTSGTLTFQPGQTVANISVPILNDNVFELVETFNLSLSGATGTGVTLLSPTTMSVMIFSNDARPSINTSAVMVAEPPPARQTFASVPIQLSNPSVETVSVNYSTVGQSAVSGDDFVGTSGTLVFAPGETLKHVQVEILADSPLEETESFALTISAPVNGLVGVNPAVITIENFRSDVPFDFDGDGKADMGVFRPSGGEWWLLKSSVGNADFTYRQFGISTDQTAPADWTGDGIADVAVFRETGEWYVLRSGLEWSWLGFHFGGPGDIAVPGDYDGDGMTDAAVYRPSERTFYIFQSSNLEVKGHVIGLPTDKPVVGDFDGDGRVDPTLWRDSTGEWFILASSNNYALAVVQFGASGDKTVAADYTGDGITDIAVWRPSEGVWYIIDSGLGGYFGFPFGLATDLPAPADYDGDGKADPTVFRPETGDWYSLRTTEGLTGGNWGIATDRPVAGAYVR